jgi:hypothetical protein
MARQKDVESTESKSTAIATRVEVMLMALT